MTTGKFTKVCRNQDFLLINVYTDLYSISWFSFFVCTWYLYNILSKCVNDVKLWWQTFDPRDPLMFFRNIVCSCWPSKDLLSPRGLNNWPLNTNNIVPCHMVHVSFRQNLFEQPLYLSWTSIAAKTCLF